MRRFLPLWEVSVYLERLRAVAEVLEDPVGVSVRSTPDPDDDYLVGLVYYRQASYLVSGDHHLLDLKKVRGGSEGALAPVLTPRQFLDDLDRGS